MIPAKKNQLANVKNMYQTDAKKVLCVCSASLLRSPTLANVLHRELGYNTRAAGSSEEYALIPISVALLYWADEIVFVNVENFNECLYYNEEYDSIIRRKAVVLSIEDDFEWNNESLKQQLLEQYNERCNRDEV